MTDSSHWALSQAICTPISSGLNLRTGAIGLDKVRCGNKEAREHAGYCSKNTVTGLSFSGRHFQKCDAKLPEPPLSTIFGVDPTNLCLLPFPISLLKSINFCPKIDLLLNRSACSQNYSDTSNAYCTNVVSATL